MNIARRHCLTCGVPLATAIHGNRKLCDPCSLVQSRTYSNGKLTRAQAEQILNGEEAVAGPYSLFIELRKRLKRTSRVWVYRVGTAWRFVWPSERDGFKRLNPGAKLVGKYDATATEADVRQDYEAAE